MGRHSVILSRHAELELVEVEQQAGVDGQGKPTYNSPVEIAARVKEQTRATVATDGSRIRADVVLWVPTGEPLLPEIDDRITWQGRALIVVDVKNSDAFDGTLIYRRLMGRWE